MATLLNNTATMNTEKGLTLSTAGKYLPHNIIVKLSDNFVIGNQEVTSGQILKVGNISTPTINEIGEMLGEEQIDNSYIISYSHTKSIVPTKIADGFISSNFGTLGSGDVTFTGTKTIAAASLSIEGGALTGGNTSFVPVISKIADSGVGGTAVTTLPSSGYFVAVKSAIQDDKVITKSELTKESLTKGYLKADSQISITNGTEESTSVGLDESLNTYIPLSSAAITTTAGEYKGATPEISIETNINLREEASAYSIDIVASALAPVQSIEPGKGTTTKGYYGEDSQFVLTPNTLSAGTNGSKTIYLLEGAVSAITGGDFSISGESINENGAQLVINRSATTGGVITEGYILSGNVAPLAASQVTKYVAELTVATGKSFSVNNSGTTTVTGGITKIKETSSSTVEWAASVDSSGNLVFTAGE